MKCSPGPFRARASIAREIAIDDGRGFTVAKVIWPACDRDLDPVEVQQANAALLSSAPDLLEALIQLRQFAHSVRPGGGVLRGEVDLFVRVDEAIARAHALPEDARHTQTTDAPTLKSLRRLKRAASDPTLQQPLSAIREAAHRGDKPDARTDAVVEMKLARLDSIEGSEPASEAHATVPAFVAAISLQAKMAAEVLVELTAAAGGKPPTLSPALRPKLARTAACLRLIRQYVDRCLETLATVGVSEPLGKDDSIQSGVAETALAVTGAEQE